MKTIDKTKPAPKFAEPVKGKAAPHPESDAGKATTAKVREPDAGPPEAPEAGRTVQVFLRGLDAALHHRFKVACARRGKSQTQVLKELILEYTRRKEGDK